MVAFLFSLSYILKIVNYCRVLGFHNRSEKPCIFTDYRKLLQIRVKMAKLYKRIQIFKYLADSGMVEIIRRD